MMRRKLYFGILAITIVTGVASGAAVRGAIAGIPAATRPVADDNGVAAPAATWSQTRLGSLGSGIPAPG